MFEIRIICEPSDIDRVSQALAATFDTGPARQYPTRDRKRVRLYFTAGHQADTRVLCFTCGTAIEWIDCPTGGWWAHDQHPADGHDARPGAWQDDDPLMEALAAALWEHCHTEGSSTVLDDPRNIAAVAAAVIRKIPTSHLPD